MGREKPVTISDDMRRLITECGETRYRIAKNTGLTQSMLSKFMAGAGLETKSLDTLGKYLGWRVIREEE